jgi:hypothetical protein
MNLTLRWATYHGDEFTKHLEQFTAVRQSKEAYAKVDAYVRCAI